MKVSSVHVFLLTVYMGKKNQTKPELGLLWIKILLSKNYTSEHLYVIHILTRVIPQ